MQARYPVVTILVTLVVTLPETGIALAQTPSATRTPVTVTVDGSKEPERIPDRIAVGMFFSIIAIPLDADARAVDSWRAKTLPIGLNRDDTRTLRTELAALHSRLTLQRASSVDANEEARRLRTPEAIANAQAVADARRGLTWTSYERLLESLSPDGAKKLRAHIARVKTQIKGIAPAAPRD